MNVFIKDKNMDSMKRTQILTFIDFEFYDRYAKLLFIC